MGAPRIMISDNTRAWLRASTTALSSTCASGSVQNGSWGTVLMDNYQERIKGLQLRAELHRAS